MYVSQRVEAVSNIIYVTWRGASIQMWVRKNVYFTAPIQICTFCNYSFLKGPSLKTQIERQADFSDSQDRKTGSKKKAFTFNPKAYG